MGSDRQAGPLTPTNGREPALGPARPAETTDATGTGSPPHVAVTLTAAGIAMIAIPRLRVGGFTLSDLLFLMATGVVVLGFLTDRTRRFAPPYARRSPTTLLAGSLLLLTAGTVSSFGSLDPFGSMLEVLRLGWVTLIWFWLLRTVAADRAALLRLVTALKVGVVIASVGAIAGYLGLLNLPAPNDWGYGSRQYGFFFHPNHLAGFLVVGLPVFVLDTSLMRSPEGQRSKVPRLAALGLGLFAMALTGSMSGAIGMLVAIATIVLLLVIARSPRRRPPGEALYGFAIVIASLLAVAWLVTSDAPVVDRFTAWVTGDTQTTRSVGSRAEYSDFVLSQLDERLVVGVGLDDLSSHFDDEQDDAGAGHSMVLKVLYEAGLPAVIGMALIMVTALRQAWSMTVAGRGTPLYPLAVVLCAMLIGANVVAQVHPVLTERYHWLPVGLVGALWTVRRREQRELQLHGLPSLQHDQRSPAEGQLVPGP